MYRLLVALALFGGCVPTSFSFTPSTRGQVGKPSGCEFAITDAPPDQDYEEIGQLKYYNGDVPKSVGALRKAIATRVCEVGGDAVIADPDTKGEYRLASVIKFNKRYTP